MALGSSPGGITAKKAFSYLKAFFISTRKAIVTATKTILWVLTDPAFRKAAQGYPAFARLLS